MKKKDQNLGEPWRTLADSPGLVAVALNAMPHTYLKWLPSWPMIRDDGTLDPDLLPPGRTLCLEDALQWPPKSRGVPLLPDCFQL